GSAHRFFEVSTAMELVVRKNDLLRELQLFQGIVERKNTIPILANVLLEAKGEEALRDREVAARNRYPDCAGQKRRQSGRGSVRLPDADLAARGFSDAARN